MVNDVNESLINIHRKGKHQTRYLRNYENQTVTPIQIPTTLPLISPPNLDHPPSLPPPPPPTIPPSSPTSPYPTTPAPPTSPLSTEPSAPVNPTPLGPLHLHVWDFNPSLLIAAIILLRSRAGVRATLARRVCSGTRGRKLWEKNGTWGCGLWEVCRKRWQKGWLGDLRKDWRSRWLRDCRKGWRMRWLRNFREDWLRNCRVDGPRVREWLGGWRARRGRWDGVRKSGWGGDAVVLDLQAGSSSGLGFVLGFWG